MASSSSSDMAFDIGESSSTAAPAVVEEFGLEEEFGGEKVLVVVMG